MRQLGKTVAMADEIGKLLQNIQQQEEGSRQQLSQVRADAKALVEAARKVEGSSSGSNFGYHSELYYGDFEIPPSGYRFNVEWGGINGPQPGWAAKTAEQVRERIEHLSGCEFENIEHDSANLVASSKELLDDVLIHLAPFHDAAGLSKEKELLNQLENFDWAQTGKEEVCVGAMRHFPKMTRDSNAVMQGSRLPAYTYYEAVAAQAEQSCDAVERFWKLSQRLLKQLLVQRDVVPKSRANDAIGTVNLICRRFHAVAVQLLNRRQKRPTLTISDEYDVQDLMHALLRLHFEDVRTEEPTPSFGGGAARMDFLLKNEQIVVEAKMTRSDLRDKGLFDELIQDVARYKNHSDCKNLICLIYDPQCFVKNPQGLINDLRKLSSESLTVDAIVVPER
jgi:hypothetical protein